MKKNEKNGKIDFKQFVLRLAILTMTIIPLKMKLRVNIYMSFHIHAPYCKHDLNNLILISKMKRSSRFV